LIGTEVLAGSNAYGINGSIYSNGSIFWAVMKQLQAMFTWRAAGLRPTAGKRPVLPQIVRITYLAKVLEEKIDLMLPLRF